MFEDSRKSNRSTAKEGKTSGCRSAEVRQVQDQIDWKTWWPFTRATGAALKQLNKTIQPDWEEALF